MEYTLLGNSALMVSKIGFGCMSLKTGQNDTEKILRKAYDAGINYFDTADVYDNGKNEELIGKTFKDNRSNIIIATKVGNKIKSNGSGFDWDASKQHILHSVDESLKRLQTDYIDLYQLHGGTMDDPMDETIEAFERLKESGKIRYYGISSIRPNVIRAYLEKSSIVSVMMQYSLLDRRPEEACFKLLHKSNIAIIARGSLAQGLLIDKTPKPYTGYNEKDVKHMAQVVHEKSGKVRTATQTALQFVLQQEEINIAVVGMRTMQQAEDVLQTMHVSKLDTDEMYILKNALKATVYEQHW